MATKQVDMEFAEWSEKFKLISPQPLDFYSNALAVAESPAHIWTYCGSDEGEWIIDGHHYVNALGFFVTELPAKPNTEYFIAYESEIDPEDNW